MARTKKIGKPATKMVGKLKKHMSVRERLCEDKRKRRILMVETILDYIEHGSHNGLTPDDMLFLDIDKACKRISRTADVARMLRRNTSKTTPVPEDLEVRIRTSIESYLPGVHHVVAKSDVHSVRDVRVVSDLHEDENGDPEVYNEVLAIKFEVSFGTARHDRSPDRNSITLDALVGVLREPDNTCYRHVRAYAQDDLVHNGVLPPRDVTCIFYDVLDALNVREGASAAIAFDHHHRAVVTTKAV